MAAKLEQKTKRKVGKDTVGKPVKKAGYETYRPQTKRAMSANQKNNRVEMCTKILWMLESGEVKLEHIWFSDETSRCANKLGANKRNNTVYKRKDQPVEATPPALSFSNAIHLAKGCMAGLAISKSGKTGRTPPLVVQIGQMINAA